MPSPSTTNLPRPKSWDEFEDICADILKRIWKDPYLIRHGRSGQKQNGVDIYGHPEHLGGAISGKYAGAQCKETDALSIGTVEKEVRKAMSFQPSLAEYLVMTTAPRDAVLQQQVRTWCSTFRVHVMFWEDISQELSGHIDLLQKHFPGWTKITTTKDQVLNMVLSSQPEDFDFNNETGVFFHAGDIKFQIILNYDPDFDEPFYEPWMNCFADQRGSRLPVYIYYEQTRVFEISCVYVDGRHIIPFPKSRIKLTINRFKYHLGRIINHPLQRSCPSWATFDNALMRAGITVQDE